MLLNRRDLQFMGCLLVVLATYICVSHAVDPDIAYRAAHCSAMAFAANLASLLVMHTLPCIVYDITQFAACHLLAVRIVGATVENRHANVYSTDYESVGSCQDETIVFVALILVYYAISNSRSRNDFARDRDNGFMLMNDRGGSLIGAAEDGDLIQLAPTDFDDGLESPDMVPTAYDSIVTVDSFTHGRNAIDEFVPSL